MRVNDDGTRTYSHTSLSLWRLCKRRWFYRYIQRVKEPPSLPASWSVWMVHKPQESSLAGQTPLSEDQWLALYQGFTDEIGGDPEDGLHTVGTGKRIFEAIRAFPFQLSNLVAEFEKRIQLSGTTFYTSKPDLVGEMDNRRTTVDFKYTESKWRSALFPWPVKPLLPYDDQLLGQAICAEADAFTRATIQINPQSGKLADIVYEERLVGMAERTEWLSETRSTVDEIESWLMRIDPKWNLAPARPWPKNEDACYAYGKPCPAMQLCKAGWRLTSLNTTRLTCSR